MHADARIYFFPILSHTLSACAYGEGKNRVEKNQLAGHEATHMAAAATVAASGALQMRMAEILAGIEQLWSEFYALSQQNREVWQRCSDLQAQEECELDDDCAWADDGGCGISVAHYDAEQDAKEALRDAIAAALQSGNISRGALAERYSPLLRMFRL